MDKMRKLFLAGSLGLLVLIVIGMIWAIAAGPSAPSITGNYTFNDQNAPALGSTTSSKIVRMYGDFQCPACRAAEAGFQYAKQKYGDTVSFFWKDFPLQASHPNALSAANAARCAEEQGKFWEYHDKLYEDQADWQGLTRSEISSKFVAYAEALSLKTDDFGKCLDERKYESKIMADLEEGKRNGVDSTPTVFFDKVKVSGALAPTEWDKYIQAQ